MRTFAVLLLLFCASVSLAVPAHVGNGQWGFIPSGISSVVGWKSAVGNSDAYWQRYKEYWGLSCSREAFLALPWYTDNYSGETLIGVWKDGRPRNMTQRLDCEPVLVAVDGNGNKFTVVMDCGNPLPCRKVPCKVTTTSATCSDGSMEIACGEIIEEQPQVSPSLLVTPYFTQVPSGFPVGTSGTTYRPLVTAGYTWINNSNPTCPPISPPPGDCALTPAQASAIQLPTMGQMIQGVILP